MPPDPPSLACIHITHSYNPPCKNPGYGPGTGTGLMRSEFLLGTAPVLNSLLEKRVSFCSSFKALSTDTSFIKIGVCYQKSSTLEFNFYYHCMRDYAMLCLNSARRSGKHARTCMWVGLPAIFMNDIAISRDIVLHRRQWL